MRSSLRTVAPIELQGTDKKRESPLDILRSLKLIRKNFGELHVNFGTPIKLDEWLEQYQGSHSDDAQLLPRLGNDLMQAINRQASANPINLVASAILTADKQAMPEQQLVVQLQHHQQLIRDLGGDEHLTDPSVSPTQLIQSAENLGWLHRNTAIRRRFVIAAIERGNVNVVSQQHNAPAGTALIDRLSDCQS